MNGHKRFLVVVEDDVSTRRALESVFGGRGWEVRSVSGVAEARSLLAGGAMPSGLILDLTLPDGEGEAILRSASGAGLNPLVAACTGSVDGNRLARVRAMQPHLIMSKPVGPEALWRFVRVLARNPGK